MAKIGVLITARLKSTRLKLKLLQPLNGLNVIQRVIQRTKMIHASDEIILCTSPSNQDLPLVRIAQQEGIYYFCGDPEDVLSRLNAACEQFDLDYFIGVTADNPLFSVYHANLICDAIRADNSIEFIYTTGTPLGMGAYAVKVSALRAVCSYKQETDTEIWGYLINRPDLFNVVELTVDDPYRLPNAPRITLDTIDDYRLFKAIFNRFAPATYIDTLDVLDMIREDSALLQLNAHVVQKDLDTDVKERIERFFTENHDRIHALIERFRHA